MWTSGRTIFAVLALPAIASVSVAHECQVIDALHDDIEFVQSALEAIRAELGTDPSELDIDHSWLKEVRACNVGRYTVWVPANSPEDHMWVTVGQDVIILKDPSQLLLFEENRKLVVGLNDDDRDGSYDSIDYQQRPLDEGLSDATVWDRDRDGCADFRTNWTKDGTRRHFLKLGGSWLELTSQGDKWGYIFKGEFMEMGDAKGAAVEAALEECLASQGDATERSGTSLTD